MRDERRRVAITGMGCVTPFGFGTETLWRNVVEARSAVKPISLFDPADLPVQFACEVPNVAGREPGLRAVEFAKRASDDAWAASGLESDVVDPDRVGVSYALGSLAPEAGWFAEEIEELLRMPRSIDSEVFEERVLETLLPLHGGETALRYGARPTNLTAELARRIGAAGPTTLLCTSCPGSLQAMITAAGAIQDGETDVMLAGGTECLVSPLGIMGFARLQALSTNNEEMETASRPFDRRRDGFVMGEGAGSMVLEEWEHARARGAVILAEWLGSGLTCDAYKITDEHPEGVSAIEAVRRALADAGIVPERVGYVNAHGSSTPMNDRIETLVMHKTLKDHARSVPISSTKSMIGHLIHGAAVVESIVTVMAMNEKVAPPTAHYGERDPRCDLDYVPNEARPHEFDVALKNAFGFGGINASVVLGAAR